VLSHEHGGRNAIAGYLPIVPTDTSDHEYSAILESERENVNDVYRVELRVNHDPPQIPLPTLSVHALTQSEVLRNVGVANEQTDVDLRLALRD
jgi:hypothetical protein